MPRLSITLTDSQNAALERIAAETGATKQSMIGLAVSAWIKANDIEPARHRELSGWYGWATVKEYEPLSEGLKHHWVGVGYDGPFETREEALAHAESVAESNREDGYTAETVVRWEDH